MEIVYLDVNKILANPNQPRKDFNKKKIEELSESIKKFGVLQAISVRKKGDIYELIAGERRLLASRNAGIKEIPCVISDISDKESAVVALVENVQRENLSFYELALTYKKIMNDFSFTQSELAERLAISQSSIANKLRILRLDDNIISDLISNNLTERHARALLKLNEVKDQKKVLKKIIRNKYNVKQTEEYIDKFDLKNKPKRTVVKQSMKDIRVFTNNLKNLIEKGKMDGLDADFYINQNDDFYEFNIKIQRRR